MRNPNVKWQAYKHAHEALQEQSLHVPKEFNKEEENTYVVTMYSAAEQMLKQAERELSGKGAKPESTRYVLLTVKEFEAISDEIYGLISSSGAHDEEAQAGIRAAAKALNRVIKRNAKLINSK